MDKRTGSRFGIRKVPTTSPPPHLPDDPFFLVHPVNGEVPPVKGRPRKLPHYANRGKTSSSGGELASARSCFSTVRTALGKLRITGLLAQFDIARSFPQFPRPLLLQPTILTSERGTRFGIRKAPNHVPPPHLPDDPFFFLCGRCGWCAKVWSRGLDSRLPGRSGPSRMPTLIGRTIKPRLSDGPWAGFGRILRCCPLRRTSIRNSPPPVCVRRNTREGERSHEAD